MRRGAATAGAACVLARGDEHVVVACDSAGSGQRAEAIDSDAVLMDRPQRLIELLGDKDFLMSPDPPVWGASFNAGVWVVRNTVRGREIMSRWASLYRASEWRQNASGSWDCSVNHNQNTCTWAGENYEQGAFIQNILPIFAYSMQIVPQTVLNGIFTKELDDGVVVYHFMGHFKEYVPSWISRMRKMDFIEIGTSKSAPLSRMPTNKTHVHSYSLGSTTFMQVL